MTSFGLALSAGKLLGSINLGGLADTLKIEGKQNVMYGLSANLI